MSGASEATLQELLAVSKQSAAAISALAGKSGSGSGSGGSGGGGAPSKERDGISKAANQFGQILGVTSNIIGGTFNKALGLATAGFNQFVAVGKGVIASQRQLAETAIEGSGGLSTFADSLKNLPLGLGLIAEAYAYQQKILEKNLHTYQELSTVGATFGGSLQEVRTAAMGVGLSMTEFSAMMKKNGPALIKLGYSAEDGARKLVKFNRDLIQGEVGQGLLGLGYSLSEVNDLLGGYATIVGGLNADQMKDQARMQQSVAAFASEMDLSAQLEGKSRQQKEEEMKKASANAALQAKLATMTQDQKDKYQLALSNALRTGGQGAADALNSTLLGLPPMTKAAQMFTAVMPGANKAVQDNAKIVQDNSKATEAEGKIRENGAKGAVAAANDIKKLGKTADALSMSQGANADLQGTINAGKKLEAQQTNQGIKTEKDAIDQQRKLIAEQEQRKKSEAGKAAQAEARAKYQASIMDQLYGILAKLFPVVEWVVKAFTDLFTVGLNFGMRLYNEVLKPAFDAIFGDVKMDDLIKPFKDFWKGLFGSGSGLDMEGVKNSIIKFTLPIKKFFSELFGSINFEEVGAKVRETFERVFGALGRITDALSSAFKGKGDGSSLGTFLQTTFSRLMDIVGTIAETIATVVGMFLESPLFQRLKDGFDKIVKIVKGAIDLILMIVQGPVGTWLFKTLFDTVEMLMTPVLAMIDIIDGVIDIIFGVVDIFQGDASAGIDKIGKALGNIVKAAVDWFFNIAQFVAKIFGFGESLTKIKTAVNEFIDQMFEVLTGWFKSIFNFFKGKSDEKKADTSAASPTTSSGGAAPAAQPDPTKWAHDVYIGTKKPGDVPAEIKGKVQALLDKPPQAWVDEVKKTQQSNNSPKTETKTAETKKEEAQKPAATPVVDLNNKDAIAVLKAIADYQRRTVDAVNGLNGNLYKRA